MISLVNLGKHYGGRTLFEGASVQLNAGSRYGLVGANGSGKTTLLKILCGDEAASDGRVDIAKRTRLGVLRQDQFMNDDERIVDVVMKGDAEAWDALAKNDTERITALDGWTLRARSSAILEGLGIPGAKHEMPLSTLSGGYKLRVLLAQVLAARPDVLLLDEPTNHLDILSIRWLEGFLARFAGCAVVISHDQRFLENVATDILDVDYGTVTLYPGRYARFMVEKEARRAQKEAEIENKQDQIDHKRAFVERFGAKATKARQAQSRLKQIEKIEAELEDLPPSSRREPSFTFPVVRPSGKDVIEWKGVEKSYAGRSVLHDVNLAVRRGEKVAIVGENGAGKSTLLKIAVGVVEPDAGTVKWGHETQPGYFAQDHREQLTNDDDTPFTFLTRVSPDTATAYVRGMLGRVLFSGDDVKKSVRALSGGEAARLVLARLMVEKPNVLLLDEPTNHLDLEAIRALVDALKAYEGTIVFVSHDRWFVNELATRIVEVKTGGKPLSDFSGTWADYLAALGDDHLDADAVSLKSKIEKKAADDGGGDAGAVTWEEAKRRKSLKASLEKKRDKLLADVEKKEGEREKLRALWVSEGFYDKTSLDDQQRLTRDEQALTSAIDAMMAEWEQVEAELAGLG